MIYIVISVIIVGLIGMWIELVEPRVAGGVFSDGDAYEARQEKLRQKEAFRTNYRVTFDDDGAGVFWRVYAPNTKSNYDYIKQGYESPNSAYVFRDQPDGTARERAEIAARAFIEKHKKAKRSDSMIYVKVKGS